MPLPEEELLPEAVMEGAGRVKVGVEPPLVVLGADVPVASAVSVNPVPVETAVSEEKGQWEGMEEEVPVGRETGPGPW